MRTEENQIPILVYAVVSSVSVWLAYAVQESWFGALMPWMALPADQFEPLNRPFSFALFGLYGVIGALLGALVSLFARDRARGIGTKVVRRSRLMIKLRACRVFRVPSGVRRNCRQVVSVSNWERVESVIRSSTLRTVELLTWCPSLRRSPAIL